MPARRGYTKKRKGYKPAYRADPYAISNLARTIIPSKRRVTHKWANNFVLQQDGYGASYNAPMVAVFSMNHMYRPVDQFGAAASRVAIADVQPGGTAYHQPLGCDQMEKVYGRYTVISAKITVFFDNLGSEAMICGMLPATHNTPFTITAGGDSANDGLEGDYSSSVKNACHYEELGAQYNMVTPNGGTALSYTVNPAKLFGSSKPLADDRLVATSVTVDGGAGAGAPTDQAYCHVFIKPMHNRILDMSRESATAEPSGGIDFPVSHKGVAMHVSIEYTAVWHEPRKLDQSL